MLSNMNIPFRRSQADTLKRRLEEPRRFIQVLAGPRQVGKTTLARQVGAEIGTPFRFASADEPALKGPAWIAQQWDGARLAARASGTAGAALFLDEIHKIPNWSETVKRLWDEDSAAGIPLKLVLLGSAPLLIGKGLSESLAGRFETIHMRTWGYGEMRDAFGLSIEEFIYYGGYPGAAELRVDPERWSGYIRDSLVETTISRDILLLSRVDKPALLRRLFELSCRYSGQMLSYTKMLGQLLDAGNTTTLAHYLDLLAGAGMATGLQKFAADAARRRGSSPKLQVFDTSLMSVGIGADFSEARRDGELWGRLVESAVGAHLANAAATGVCELSYWREGNLEVDFVVSSGKKLTAIEVKSSRAPVSLPGMEAFASRFAPCRTLLVGGDGIAIEDFLSLPLNHWIQ
jgi:predicted AAA+ superfamily ATPase